MGTKQRPHYDYMFDPIQAMQKVPILGDSAFMMNQAVLSSANENQRTFYKASRPRRNLDLISTGNWTAKDGFDGTHALSSGATTTTGAYKRPTAFTAKSKGETGTLFDNVFSSQQ